MAKKAKISRVSDGVALVDYNPYNPGGRIFNTQSNYVNRYIGTDWSSSDLDSICDPSHRALTLRQIIERQSNGLSVDVDTRMGFTPLDTSHMDNMSIIEKIDYGRFLQAEVARLNLQVQHEKAEFEKERITKAREKEIEDKVAEALKNSSDGKAE